MRCVDSTGMVLSPDGGRQGEVAAELYELYFASVGRGASLLLNIPPDRRGRIAEADVTALRGFRRLLDATFGVNLSRGARASASNMRGRDRRFDAATVLDGRPDTYWSTDDGIVAPSLELDLGREVAIDVVRLREHLPLGQRLEGVAIDAWRDGAWSEVARATSVGACRLLRFSPVTTRRVRLRVTDASACPALTEVALFRQTL